MRSLGLLYHCPKNLEDLYMYFCVVVCRSYLSADVHMCLSYLLLAVVDCNLTELLLLWD